MPEDESDSTCKFFETLRPASENSQQATFFFLQIYNTHWTCISRRHCISFRLALIHPPQPSRSLKSSNRAEPMGKPDCNYKFRGTWWNLEGVFGQLLQRRGICALSQSQKSTSTFCCFGSDSIIPVPNGISASPVELLHSSLAFWPHATDKIPSYPARVL